MRSHSHSAGSIALSRLDRRTRDKRDLLLDVCHVMCDSWRSGRGRAFPGFWFIGEGKALGIVLTVLTWHDLYLLLWWWLCYRTGVSKERDGMEWLEPAVFFFPGSDSGIGGSCFGMSGCYMWVRNGEKVEDVVLFCFFLGVLSGCEGHYGVKCWICSFDSSMLQNGMVQDAASLEDVFFLGYPRTKTVPKLVGVAWGVFFSRWICVQATWWLTWNLVQHLAMVRYPSLAYRWLLDAWGPNMLGNSLDERNIDGYVWDWDEMLERYGQIELF